MNVNVETIKRLRQETGAGILECRTALEKTGYDFEEALSDLRALAAVKAEQQTEREARHARLELYEHGDGRIGVMVEISTVTDFARNSEAFRALGREIALQIAANEPRYVSEEEIPQEALDRQAGEAAEWAQREGKPENITERIIRGRVEKYKNQYVLLRQPYIRDESISIAELLNQVIHKTGENIVINRFVRWEIDPTSPIE